MVWDGNLSEDLGDLNLTDQAEPEDLAAAIGILENAMGTWEDPGTDQPRMEYFGENQPSIPEPNSLAFRPKNSTSEESSTHTFGTATINPQGTANSGRWDGESTRSSFGITDGSIYHEPEQAAVVAGGSGMNTNVGGPEGQGRHNQDNNGRKREQPPDHKKGTRRPRRPRTTAEEDAAKRRRASLRKLSHQTYTR